MIRISAFVDCDSQSAVIRIPYSLLADLILNCPPSDDLTELIRWLDIAAARSPKLRTFLDKIRGDSSLARLDISFTKF